MSTETNTEEKTARRAAAAERVLNEAAGGTAAVRFGTPEPLRERYRNWVLRCPVEAESPAGMPPSVIIKGVEGREGRVYDPDQDAPEDSAWRFYNEWASNRFLTELAPEPPLSARLLGGSREAGFIILEDLGDGPCLADLLQGDDSAAAEKALLSYAASMGRLHAVTAGKEGEFRRIRQELSGSPSRSGETTVTKPDDPAQWAGEVVPRFVEQCAAVGVSPAPGFDDEIAVIRLTVEEPGPFLAFAPGDTCPDNHRIDPQTGGLRFFDFEFGGFRHALLDAAYFFLPFPTCWCVRRLPNGMPERMGETYRTALSRGIPEAADDSQFYPALACACAYWTITSVGWGLERALKEDTTWGLSTLRQRHPLRLENFAQLSEARGHLPAIGETARGLAGKLRSLWPPQETEMPPYPPFPIQEKT